MTRDVIILIGSMGGVAELAAEDMAEELRCEGYSAMVMRMEQAGLETFDLDALFIVCTSSCGEGAIPLNGRPLFGALEMERPDLRHVHFSVFALGDREHHAETFCFAGHKFDRLLGDLGAQRFAVIGEHDAGGRLAPEDAARHWVRRWIATDRPTWWAASVI